MWRCSGTSLQCEPLHGKTDQGSPLCQKIWTLKHSIELTNETLWWYFYPCCGTDFLWSFSHMIVSWHLKYSSRLNCAVIVFYICISKLEITVLHWHPSPFQSVASLLVGELACQVSACLGKCCLRYRIFVPFSYLSVTELYVVYVIRVFLTVLSRIWSRFTRQAKQIVCESKCEISTRWYYWCLDWWNLHSDVTFTINQFTT